jgi:hypothetical protein
MTAIDRYSRNRVVKSGKTASEAPATADTEDIFHMTNLAPRMTGLPMSVWVSPRGNARHDVRIKVNMTHGRQMSIDNTAVVALRPVSRVAAGRLSPEDRRLVYNWIRLNYEAILAYWNEEIETDELIDHLKRLPLP